jgi:hypothetical protein
MKIRPVGAELFHADGHDKANTLLFAILHTRLQTLYRWSNSEVCCKYKKMEYRAFNVHGGL